MTLKFYYDLMSQPARAVYMFLKATGINYVDCPVALRKGEHMTPEYERITAFKRVPVIVDDDFTLTESVAIMKYLSIKHKVPDHWYPNDARKQARVDEFLNWQHLGLRANAAPYFLIKITLSPNVRKVNLQVLNPIISGNPVNEDRLKRQKEELDKSLDTLERVFLKNSPFVNGSNEISIADLLAVAELEQPIAAGYDFLSDRPILAAYVKRVKERLNPHYEFAHQFIWRLRDKNTKAKL